MKRKRKGQRQKKGRKQGRTYREQSESSESSQARQSFYSLKVTLPKGKEYFKNRKRKMEREFEEFYL
jgi:hypothetical protein